ncbi:MAG TPA: hypothetical protein VKQ28_14700 [Candidatus Acidoferrum sp.]|nr:hypothetical protein [Candidatus Acidoferrum sp.]
MSINPRNTRNGNIVVLKLRKKNPGSFAHTIYQEDLERLLLRKKKAREANEELNEIEDYIATALRAGAHVEDGVHTAELVPVDRSSFRVRACKYFRLSVR